MQNLLNKRRVKHKLVFSCAFCIALIFFCFVFNAQAAQTDFQSPAFRQENVSFSNGEVKLNGNLFTPASGANLPVVVILHGSGPDEGLEYKVYAEAFAKAGIAALVYDKRGSGKSGGDWRKRPFEFLAGDALAAVRFLKNRPEINSEKVGLWGISQGGWTVAYAASRSKDVAFVISVAGNGISPTQQEMFRKDEVYKTLGYSERARDTAIKFWKMVFDWLILVDEKKFPLSQGILESELAGASIGLNYNPLPDWEKVSQPVLLVHGTADKLSPHEEAIAGITAALEKGGNRNYTVKVFPNASHTITTNKTGLEFDWDEHFAPNYFQTTTDWVLSQTDTGSDKANYSQEHKFQSSPDFAVNGRYGELPWYGQTYPQLLAMILFPLFFLIYFFAWVFNFFKNRKLKSNAENLRSSLTGFLSLLNLALLLIFYAFLATSVFPQGISLMSNYSIPVWQRALPLIGVISLVLTVLLIIQNIFGLKNVSVWQILFITIAVIFTPWLYYWNLIGLWF